MPPAKYFCDIIVELTAKRRFQSYSAFWKRQDLTQAENLLRGTDWDKYMCMEKGEIAHFDQKKGHNRWCPDPQHLTVVALWVKSNAMSTGSFVDLV